MPSRPDHGPRQPSSVTSTAPSKSRAPSLLQPRAKAAPVTDTIASTGTPPSKSAASSIASSSAAQWKRRPVKSSLSGATSDKHTIWLIRRTLCGPHLRTSGESDESKLLPLENLLPPLTSSNEIDLQLYAFVAIIVRETLKPWYSKISVDHDFTEEVVQVTAHCTRAIEQRLKNVDVQTLLWDDIPRLLESHIKAYEASHTQGYLGPMARDPRHIYHTIHPHPALSPFPDEAKPDTVIEQEENEDVYRQLLVQNTLAALLPPEDLENVCLRTLVREVVSEALLGKVLSERLCEGWFVMNLITRVAGSVQERISARYDRTRVANDDGRPSPPDKHSQIRRARPGWERQRLWWQSWSAVSAFFWRILHLALLAGVLIRWAVKTLADTFVFPSPAQEVLGEKGGPPPPPRFTSPVVAMGVFPFISSALSLPRRKPWLANGLSSLKTILLTGPGQIGGQQGPIDRLLRHAIPYAPSPRTLSALLRDARATLFPHNALTLTSESPPSAEEQADAQAECAAALLALVPAPLRVLYFGTLRTDTQHEQVVRLLDVLQDDYCNRHLLFALLELCLVRVCPELAVE
ncbi:MAG: hypothetical protein M1825_006480 [Sarcosagium campestre]|nr:MAG: hypothetical protein M1825_006480 [Sarcosagium campestre]